MKKLKIKAVTKFTGKIYWTTPSIYSIPVDSEAKTTSYVVAITRAIKSDDRFTIDWQTKEFVDGELIILSKDNINFQGQVKYVDGDTGKVSGRLYNNNEGCLLIGQWIELGDDFTWIAELKKVNKFSDQKNEKGKEEK